MTDTDNVINTPQTDFIISWKYALITCGIALLTIIIAYWTTYAAIVEIWWRSETFAHGFIILPIVGYLIWRKREVLRGMSPQPAPIALVFMLAATIIWLLGYAADIAVIQHVAVVAFIPVIIWVCLGTQVAQSITFPLLYLFFAAPFGDFLVEPLQDITAVFSVWAIQVTGIPVYMEGRFIYIPSGNFEVAQACSGIRYLIASLALGTLYAYMTYKSYWRRFFFITLSAIVPIIANGVRAYGIIMLAHLSDYSLAVGVDHIIYGWLFFGVVIFALIWIGSYFRDQVPEVVNMNSAQLETSAPVRVQSFAIWGIMSIVIASSSSVFAYWLDNKQTGENIVRLDLPSGQNGWQGPDGASENWQPKYVGAVESKGAYHKDGITIDVYSAFYPKQTEGAELINWHNKVFNNKQSKRLSGGEATLPLESDNGKDWKVLDMQIESKDGNRLIIYWYEINGKPTTSSLIAKLYEMQRRLTASPKGAAALVLSTTYEITPQEAMDKLVPFLNDMMPALREITSR